MNVSQSVERFIEQAAAGRVVNLRTGTVSVIDDSTRNSIISCALGAFRHAAGTTDLETVPYEAFADKLAEYALAEAAEFGLADASNRASRCRRFVRTVDGRKYLRRRSALVMVNVPWQCLDDGLRAGGRRMVDNYRKDLVRFVDTVGIAGIRRPDELPSDRLSLIKLLEVDKRLSRRRILRLISAYRNARNLALASDPTLPLPDPDVGPLDKESGLRSLPDIASRLAVAGCVKPVSKITAPELIEVLAPEWHATLRDYFAHRPNRGKRWRKRRCLASSRVLAELVRAGQGELTRAHPALLILSHVDTGQIVSSSIPRCEDWAARLFPHLEVPDEGPVTKKVLLLEHLATSMAAPSAQRSRLRPADPTQRGMRYFTDSLRSDVRAVGDLAIFAIMQSRTLQQDPDIAATAQSKLAAFKKSMKDQNSLVNMTGYKAKEKLLKRITYPMAVFLGLPALRKEVLRAEAEWVEVVTRDQCGPESRRLQYLESRYDDALTRYAVFSVLLADGLRIANYAHARLGLLGREDGMRTHTGPDGSTVSSYTHVLPILLPDGNGLVGVETNFYGDDHEDVKLKMDKVVGGSEFRERPHWLRPGLVDMRLFWKYLTEVRPKRLLKQGLITDVCEYSVTRDVEEWNFALFVSPERSELPYAALTGAYAPDTLSAMFGEVLHWVCVDVLGRKLPAFGSASLTKDYPAVFRAHSSRLLAGTFLYGVLGRAEEAETFLNDTRETVGERYRVVEASMVHKVGWEHPRYFEELFKRVWDRHETIDWVTEDPLPGIPNHLRPKGYQ